MALLPILQYPDPRLHTVAKPVAQVDDRIKQLVDDMLETMYEAKGVGLALGQGLTLEQALAGKVSVAEGVASAPAVRALARKVGVEVPICEAVAAILAGEIGVDAAIARLLSRPLKSEA